MAWCLPRLVAWPYYMPYMNTGTIWRTSTASSSATEALGQRLGQLIKPPLLIELRSDLGGGKTTFMRGLAKGLGVKTAVTSPSFTLSQEYPAKSGMKLYHFDFYRLSESGVLADQLAEALSDPSGVVAVEWSDVAKDVLPPERLTVEFKTAADNPDVRELILSSSQKYESLARKLKTEQEKLRL